MIVLKKITFLDNDEEIDSKLGKLLKSNFYVPFDDEEDTIKVNPQFAEFLSVNQEIDEYSCDLDKRNVLVVTRENIWKKFMDMMNFAGVRLIEQDIQEDFYTGKIQHELFQINVNLYMLKYMSVDEVLDKMNKYGKEFLTEIDYEILKKTKK